MKTIALILLSSLLSIISFAQDFLNFPDSNATWITGFDHWDDPMTPPLETEIDEIKWYCLNGQDTLIDGLAYTVLTNCSGVVYGYVRDSSGTQYIMEAGSTEEYILCDFNADTGDTLYNLYPPGIVYSLVAGDKYVADFSGVSRRVVEIGSSRWIEGIGNENGLLSPLIESVSGGTIVPLCMSYNDTIWYDHQVGYTNEVGKCAYYLELDESETSQELTIYPNPSTGLFQVTYNAPLTLDQLVIVDALGKRVTTNVQKTSAGFSIDLSGLPNGVYYLTQIDESGSQQQRLIKMN